MDDSGEFERLLAEIRSIRESKIIHEKGLEAFVGFTTESDFLDLKADARAWSSLFEQHFLHSDIGDDLLFYVKIGGGVGFFSPCRLKRAPGPPQAQRSASTPSGGSKVPSRHAARRNTPD
jgi:hypothetical protein